jgi:hypothetical protein
MQCERCVMSDDIAGITIGKSGQCNMCDSHDAHERKDKSLPDLFDRIRHDGRGRQYDCICGISGGLDSTYMVRMAESFGMRVLLVHFDNGFNHHIAEENIKSVIDRTGYPMIRFHPDKTVYNRLCLQLLATGLPDADIANDIGMQKLVLMLAKQYDIKWVLNGHNYQYEGWNPLGWTYMDGRYLESINGRQLPDYMRLGLAEQMLNGVKQARPYYEIDDLSQAHMMKDCEAWCGWLDYGGKHCENLYTEWVTKCYLSPRGIDKRRNYLSADIRSGRIDKHTAWSALNIPMVFSGDRFTDLCERLGVTKEYMNLVCYNNHRIDRERFASYRGTLKAIKPIVWVASKCDLVPESFYRKYCK